MGMAAVVVGVCMCGEHLEQGGPPIIPISPAILAPESLSLLRVGVIWG